MSALVERPHGAAGVPAAPPQAGSTGAEPPRHGPGDDAPVEASLRRLTYYAAGAFALLFGVFGGWASLAQITGAVVVEGHMVVESSSKVIKHRDGGIVEAILVRDGDRVAAGQVLVRLDGTMAAAELGVIETRLVHALARAARLRADVAGGDMEPPDNWYGLEDHPEVATVLAEERSLLSAIRARRSAERSRLSQRKAQLHEEIVGHEARKTAASTRLDIVAGQLAGMTQASEEGFIARVRVQELQGRVAEIEGEIGMTTASIASAREQMLSAANEAVLIADTARAEALQERRELQGRILELLERRHAAADTLRRAEIRAPTGGVVRALSVHGTGAVVGPGEPVMSIVPEGERLVVEGKLRPVDIDQVRVGQPAEVGFPGLNSRTVDRVEAKVVHVDADLTEDQGPLPPHYVIRVGLDAGKLPEIVASLVPGMPAQIFVTTAERTPLSYLLRPMLDQFATAMKEE